jgi:hypothetical protein
MTSGAETYFGVETASRCEDKLHMFAVGQSLHRSVCRTRMPASSPGLNDWTWTFCHWISAAYEVPSAAARDEPWDQSALDRVFEAYRVSEQGLRAAFKDFHRLGKLYRLVRISIVNLFLELKAIVRRRSKTWYPRRLGACPELLDPLGSAGSGVTLLGG